jgi:hypothetical protein
VEFSLRKWYLDVVADDGRLGIVYWAEIRHGRLRHDMTGLLLHQGTGEAPAWRFSLRSTPAPELLGSRLHWAADCLGVTIDGEAGAAPFEHRLLQTAEGAIDWRCVLPRARLTLRTPDATLEGLGYAEWLDLVGIAPWSIPADEIRWGRFLTDETSLVWIDWRGECPRRYVFRDGRPVAAAELTDERVRLADGSELTLLHSQVIGAETLGHLLAPLKPLTALVRPLALTQQTRWRSRGELRDPGAAPRAGWALHERLRRR